MNIFVYLSILTIFNFLIIYQRLSKSENHDIVEVRRLQFHPKLLLNQKFKTYSGVEALIDIDEMIFRPFGFSIKKATYPFVTLEHAELQNCSEVTQLSRIRKPVRYIPDRKLNRFLMGKFAGVSYKYVDDRRVLKIMDESWNHLNEMLHEWSTREIVSIGKNRDLLSLHHALLQHPIYGQNGLVVSNIDPVAELLTLKNEAQHIWSTGLTPRTSKNWRINTTSEFLDLPKNATFDFIVTSGLVEKLGLGRFGEKLDPSADLKLFQKLFCLLKPGGLLFLEVPIGKDSIIFNGFRIYGIIRLPMLISGFEWIGTYSAGNVANLQIDAKYLWNLPNFQFDRRTIVLRRLPIIL